MRKTAPVLRSYLVPVGPGVAPGTELEILTDGEAEVLAEEGCTWADLSPADREEWSTWLAELHTVRLAVAAIPPKDRMLWTSYVLATAACLARLEWTERHRLVRRLLSEVRAAASSKEVAS